MMNVAVMVMTCEKDVNKHRFVIHMAV